MRFTDYYAEASYTAGRANFITGELPIRTALTTVGQAGSPLGMPAEAPTTATVFKSMGYATGQFGKNHLGDLNKFLPCVHGFDEFFGYLYHLEAMEDPDHPNYPQALKDKVGPRTMLTCLAADKDDSTEQPRWGKEGDGPRENLVVHRGTAQRRPRRQHHPRVQHGQRGGELHLARRRPDSLRRRQGDGDGRRLPRASDGPLARQGARRQGPERHLLGARLVPDLRRGGGRLDIPDELKKGKQIGTTTYKVHLDGYNQLDVLTGKGPSKRHEIFYLARDHARRRPHRRLQVSLHRPAGRLGGRTVKVDWPIIVNLRLDPFERTGLGESLAFYNWFAYEFWRFVFVKQQISTYAQTFLDFPPHAEGRDLQPGSAEGGAREEDGGAEEPTRRLTLVGGGCTPFCGARPWRASASKVLGLPAGVGL